MLHSWFIFLQECFVFEPFPWSCLMLWCLLLLLAAAGISTEFRSQIPEYLEDNGTNLKFEFHEWYPPVVTCTSQVRVTTWDTVCIVAVTTKRRNLSFFQKRFWQRPLKNAMIGRFSSTKLKNLPFCFDLNNKSKKSVLRTMYSITVQGTSTSDVVEIQYISSTWCPQLW